MCAILLIWLTLRFAVLHTMAVPQLSVHQALPGGDGVMFAARCTSGAVIAAIDKLGVQAKASVASVNGPKSVVIAGAEAEVAAVLGELGEKASS